MKSASDLGGAVLRCLQRIAGMLDRQLSALDVERLSPRDATALLRAAIAVERRAAALKTLLVARAASGSEWVRDGHRSEEAWVSSETGVSYGEAAATLRASKKLEELPEVEAAVRNGDLSDAQTREIADAATPEDQQDLLDEAKRGGFDKLRKKCRNAKAAQRSEGDEQARQRKAHGERFHKSWIDNDGAYNYAGKCSAFDGAAIDAAIAAETDKVFKKAYQRGEREPLAAYRFDAFKRLVTCSKGPDEDKRRARTDVVIRVDATRLAGGDGICETSTGPIPAHEAIGAILAGAFIKIVQRDGVDITKVSHVGRHIPAELRTAILERDGFMCVRPGCGATHQLEMHHYVVDYGAGGATAYWNLGSLCSHDHDLVTTGGHDLRGGPGNWEWILPPDRAGP